MPYKKNYRRRYRKDRTSRYLGYAGSAAATAAKALIIAQGVKKLMNVEYKFHDKQNTSTAISDTPIILQLSNIPQGDTDITRDGAQVKCTRLSCKYFITTSPDALSTIFRVMIILDRQTNQAIYSIADLLADVTTLDNLVSMNNLDNKYRFHVYYNKVHSFSNVGHNASFHEFNKELNLKLRYDASVPDITDLTSNSLSMVVISNQPTNTASFTLFSRLRYVDN